MMKESMFVDVMRQLGSLARTKHVSYAEQANTIIKLRLAKINLDRSRGADGDRDERRMWRVVANEYEPWDASFPVKDKD